jgi:hypothetical protein
MRAKYVTIFDGAIVCASRCQYDVSSKTVYRIEMAANADSDDVAFAGGVTDEFVELPDGTRFDRYDHDLTFQTDYSWSPEADQRAPEGPSSAAELRQFFSSSGFDLGVEENERAMSQLLIRATQEYGAFFTRFICRVVQMEAGTFCLSREWDWEVLHNRWLASPC